MYSLLPKRLSPSTSGCYNIEEHEQLLTHEDRQEQSISTTSLQQIHVSLLEVASWANMPHKGQMAILAISRFVDFLQMASLQTCIFHQLRHFEPNLPDSSISHQAGILQGSFTACQVFSSILLSHAADNPRIGRKNVLVIGLAGTGISMVGIGLSTSFTQAMVWRTLGGAINGTVGSARTMVAETIPKPWHSRAFLLFPVAYNLAYVIGPRK